MSIKEDFRRAYIIREDQRRNLTKQPTKEEEYLYYYRLGRNQERETFRFIISDMRSQLTKALINLQTIFAKYKREYGKDGDEVKRRMIVNEEQQLNKVITDIQASNQANLETFTRGDKDD
jgi:hypothetical protein